MAPIIAVIGFLIFIKNREIFIFSICFFIGFTILAVGELAKHTHTANASLDGNHRHLLSYHDGDGTGQATARVGSGGEPTWRGEGCQYSGTHGHSIVIDNIGSSQPHNNMPPYLSVYIWKRVA